MKQGQYKTNKYFSQEDFEKEFYPYEKDISLPDNKNARMDGVVKAKHCLSSLCQFLKTGV